MINHADEKEGTLYFIEQTVPCILHLENCTLLKTLTIALIKGLSKAQGKHTNDYIHISKMDDQEEQFIEAVANIMKTEILGSALNIGQ